jgi:hypothetical protein
MDRRFRVALQLCLQRTTISCLSQVVSLFQPLSRHCFGAFAAPGACEASALPAAPFRFWLPRAGTPRKAASGLGCRAHSLTGARDRGQEQEKRMYLNRILSSVFSATMPKRRSATQRTSRCFRWPGRTTPAVGNRGRNGIAASRSGNWRTLLPHSPRVLTSPSKASCAATNTGGKSLSGSATRRRSSLSASGRSCRLAAQARPRRQARFDRQRS